MVYIYLDGHIVKAQPMLLYILIIEINKLFSYFSSHCFQKHIENTTSVFPLSYTSTCKSLTELKKKGKTRFQPKFPQHFSFSQKLLSVSLNTDAALMHCKYYFWKLQKQLTISIYLIVGIFSRGKSHVLRLSVPIQLLISNFSTLPTVSDKTKTVQLKKTYLQQQGNRKIQRKGEGCHWPRK